MSDQTESVDNDVPAEDQIVDVEEDFTDEEAPAEQEIPEEPTEAPNDAVADAIKQRDALQAELDALKNSDTNIFEQNEILKKKVEDAKKLAEIAVQNKELQSQLDAIKKNSLVEGMIASGQLNNGLRDWADGMSYDQLQEFSKHAPKAKTILDIKNDATTADDDMEKWHNEQNKSRIL